MLYEPSEINTAFRTRWVRTAMRGEEKDSREMPYLPGLRLLCRLVTGDMMSVKDTGVCLKVY